MGSSYNFLTGVNLGGWLVAEKWITPSLFKGTTALDEYSLATSKEGRRRLAEHRASFITESDIAWLATQGVNALRIPIGYWLFDGALADARQEPSAHLLDQVLDWAAAHQMRVLVDLHSAVGSQNGRDHSGRIGAVNWSVKDNQIKTIETLRAVTRRYRDHPAFWGIGLINEPRFGLMGYTIRHFHRAAYEIIRQEARPGTYTVFADGYRPRLLSGSLKARAGYPVVMDVHFYQIFGPCDKRRSVKRHLALAKKRTAQLHALQRHQPVIVGEWSGTLPNRPNHKVVKDYLAAQQASYAHALGWFYWTYKTEGQGAWNFRATVEKGLFTPGGYEAAMHLHDAQT